MIKKEPRKKSGPCHSAGAKKKSHIGRGKVTAWKSHSILSSLMSCCRNWGSTSNKYLAQFCGNVPFKQNCLVEATKMTSLLPFSFLRLILSIQLLYFIRQIMLDSILLETSWWMKDSFFFNFYSAYSHTHNSSNKKCSSAKK